MQVKHDMKVKSRCSAVCTVKQALGIHQGQKGQHTHIAVLENALRVMWLVPEGSGAALASQRLLASTL